MAGSKSDSLENSILKLVFNNVGIPNLGDASGIQASAVAGNLYIRLFNTSTVSDSLTGTEVSYDGYAAGGIAVPRTIAGFTVLNNNVKNAGQLQFGICLSGTETVRYFGIYKDNITGTESHRLYWGTLPDDYIVSTGSVPTVPAGYLNVNEN